jgi:hypothetical protein
MATFTLSQMFALAVLQVAFHAAAAAGQQGGGNLGANPGVGNGLVLGGGWMTGRSTYYGAPERIAKAYDPSRCGASPTQLAMAGPVLLCTGLAYASVKTDAPRLTLKHPMGVCDCRGDGSFGILSYGSCGYTNSDASIPFANDAVAASADANPDYPGSCGRCYEVRCKPGLVLGGCRTRVIAGLQNVSGSWESYRRQQGSQAALTHIHRVSSACCSLHDVGSPPLHMRVLLAVSADRGCGC